MALGGDQVEASRLGLGLVVSPARKVRRRVSLLAKALRNAPGEGFTLPETLVQVQVSVFQVQRFNNYFSRECSVCKPR